MPAVIHLTIDLTIRYVTIKLGEHLSIMENVVLFSKKNQIVTKFIETINLTNSLQLIWNQFYMMP